MTTKRNPYYDGRTVFHIDAAQLRSGDIILTRNRRGESKMRRFLSAIIAVAGKSNFSHALICSQPPTMIEAIDSGVSTFSIARSFYHEKRDVQVLRYKDPVISRRASAKAGLFLGKEYSVEMAIRSVSPVAAGANEPMVKTFCSALVAAAYCGSGAPEFQSINPYQITPGHLTRMVFFEDVTSQVSRSMLAPSNIEEMAALDGERLPSPFDGQAKALFLLHASVADDIEDFIRQWNLSLEVPTTFFETLTFLVRALKWATEGDDVFMQEHFIALRSIDQKLAEAFDQSDLHRMLEWADELDAENLKRDLQESFKSAPDIDVDSIRSMLKTTEGQIASRSWPLEDANREMGLSLAWDRWCDSSKCVIEGLEIRLKTLREILGRIDPMHSSAG